MNKLKFVSVSSYVKIVSDNPVRYADIKPDRSKIKIPAAYVGDTWYIIDVLKDRFSKEEIIKFRRLK